MIGRFSSRRAPLATILTQDLAGARRYDRIAGYFTSSILEVAGEALDRMAPGAVARVICNSSLDPLDVITAHAAKQAMYREWCESLPVEISPALKQRLEHLYQLLSSKRLQVRVLPDSAFGLIHGKAGVLERADASTFCFMGSTNESKSGWKLNYELVWTDDSPEGVDWVQDEFDALWASPAAFDLADSVIQDIERQTRRTVIAAVQEWKSESTPDPAAPIVELPIYRRENGLWAHQKYFIRKAFEEHQRGGARFVLADEVGLGKTVQLALSAKLMALWGDRPVLVLVPKPLVEQWQDELRDLLQMPSAIWTGQQWIDERGNVYPGRGVEELRRCPRRVGIVSTGLAVQHGRAAEILQSLDFECVIVDEAHHARRRNVGPTHRNEDADANNLLQFLRAIGPHARSVLLASATPVQLDPIEAWDLLDALGRGADSVLGSLYGRWRSAARAGLDIVAERLDPPEQARDTWEWVRDPLPPIQEGVDFRAIRSRLQLKDTESWARPEAWDLLGVPERSRIERMKRSFFAEHNPYIRHIVRRTRRYLEETLDPATNEPFLKPVRVRLFGESAGDAIPLAPHLEDAFHAAEAFCDAVGKRPGLNSGILKTLLLRRVGSTIHAGRRSAQKLLGSETDAYDEDDDDAEELPGIPTNRSALYPLHPDEESELRRFLQLLDVVDDDPKAAVVERLLRDGEDGSRPWLEEGCIIFSQYYDSVLWLAQRLSAAFPNEPIGVYAGGAKSGVIRAREWTRLPREEIKRAVRQDELRLVIGTDAASEGLNLQRLGTLINLDLPWNPTRLEQRKGRIQRIGQERNEVLVYNMRYRGSVEDRVHDLLSSRQEAIYNLFGQLPDTLEDVWTHVALHNDAKAREVIDQVPAQHPFQIRYDRIEQVDWESCSRVLDSGAQVDVLMKGWS